MLGLRRFEERIQGEAQQADSFISDGSVLHEWAYGVARMRVGMNPGAPLLHRASKRIVGLVAKPFFQQYINAYGAITKERARKTYDVFIHLPVEFAMNADGHRPVSEHYRRVSDQLLLEAVRELKIRHHLIRGSVHERLTKIVELLDLPLVSPLPQAILIANERIQQSREMVAERLMAAQSPESVGGQIRAAIPY